MFPENLLQACFQQVETTYVPTPRKLPFKKGGTGNETEIFNKRKQVFKDGTNVLGLIVFCIAFGVVAGQMGPQSDVMIKFFVQVSRISSYILVGFAVKLCR